MNLPADIPTTNPPLSGLDLGNLTEAPPPVTSQQRSADFNKRFSWRGKELVFSVAGEIYYRELRTHMNAPELYAYKTLGDFTSEAPRVLYCSSLSAKEIRSLQILPAEKQIECYGAWVESNIKLNELIRAAEVASEINAAIARARTEPLETDGDEVGSMGN